MNLVINEFCDPPPPRFLCTHIHLSMYIFSAFNGHMKVLFCLTMIFLQYNEAAVVQSLDLCDPDI